MIRAILMTTSHKKRGWHMNPIVPNHRLVSLRKASQLTQEQLATKIGVTQSMIAHCEAGSKDPGKENKIKLAAFFGVTVEYLFYEVYYDLLS